MATEKRKLKIHGAYKALLFWVAIGLVYVWFMPLTESRRTGSLIVLLSFYGLNLLWYLAWLVGLVGKKKPEESEKIGAQTKV